jgi:acyl carrier protein
MEEITLADVIEVLEDVRDDIDYENETALVTDKLLDSFDILSIISTLNDAYDISIPAAEIVPENFNSAASLLAMVERLIDED